MEFGENGLLAPGFHEIELDEFEKLFVENFTTSQTRRRIFENFKKWRENLLSQYSVFEIWMDGSFVTSKVNPNDVDIVIFVHIQDYVRLGQNWENIRNADDIDAYYTLAICEESEKCVEPVTYYSFVNNRNYWRGQFGFDRKDSPKGIIVLKCTQQEVRSQGGDSQCQ